METTSACREASIPWAVVPVRGTLMAYHFGNRRGKSVSPAGFEPATFGFGGLAKYQRNFHLSSYIKAF
jgi:hypothetical protein